MNKQENQDNKSAKILVLILISIFFYPLFYGILSEWFDKYYFELWGWIPNLVLIIYTFAITKNWQPNPKSFKPVARFLLLSPLLWVILWVIIWISMITGISSFVD